MTRAAIVADSHFDFHSAWRARECVATHRFIAEDAAAQGAQITIHTGDLSERRTTGEERLAEAAWITAMAQFGPVVLVRGNHDVPRELALFATLDTPHPVIVAEDPRVWRGCGITVGCLPWPRRAELAATLLARKEAPTEPSILRLFAEQRRALAEEMAACPPPRVLAAHVMIQGARVTKENTMCTTGDIEMSLDELLEIPAELYALGHIHQGQMWTRGGRAIVYPGSVYRTAYGALEEKYYLLADLQEDVRHERRRVPTRRMLLLEGDLDGTELRVKYASDHETEVPFAIEAAAGADVRVRYRFPLDRRPVADAAYDALRRSLREAGATDVKGEPQPIAAAAPPRQKESSLLERVCRAAARKGAVLDDARRARLVTKLAMLESATRPA